MLKQSLAILALLLQTSSILAQEYSFVAAPRGTRDEEMKTYEPVVKYLSAGSNNTIKYVTNLIDMINGDGVTPPGSDRTLSVPNGIGIYCPPLEVSPLIPGRSAKMP